MPKKTVETIVESGNDYVIQVKGNQKTLFKEIQKTIVEQLPIDTFEISEKGHGRHSFWSVSVFNAISSPKSDEWIVPIAIGIKRFIHVHKEVFYTDTKRKKKQTFNDRLYISSQNCNSAEYFHQGIRKHWSIENQLHWVKDVIHNEDKNRIKTNNGPVNASIISTIAINIHRKNNDSSITDSQILFGANVKELFNIYRNS